MSPDPKAPDPAWAFAAQRLSIPLELPPEQGVQLEGHSLADLAKQFDTPLYVHSARALHQAVDEVQAAFGPEIEVLYSIKANPLVALTALFHGRGLGCEIASIGELRVAQAAGVNGAALQFAGPGKNQTELRAALDADLELFIVESREELSTLAKLAAERKQTVRVALRVNPEQQVTGSRMRMGGGGVTKFGVDAADIPEVYALAANLDGIEPVGLHVYAGTQCFDVDAWLANADALLELADACETESKCAVTWLDFGGGFGVPTFIGDPPPFDVERAGAGLRTRMLAREQNLATSPLPRGPSRYVIELGRFLTAGAGTYITRIGTTKRSRAHHVAIMDGGLHQHGVAAGVGAVLKRPMVTRIEAGPGSTLGSSTSSNAATESAEAEDPNPKIVLAGPLCTPADALPADESWTRAPRVGDLCAVFNSGAYGLTFSSGRFLSHPSPAEVLIEDGKPRVVRMRGRPEDAIADQLL